MKKLLLLLMILFSISVVLNAQTTYTVNSTADTNTGSGTTGTLRYVLTAINTAAVGNNTIDMTGITGTITLTSALPAINYEMTINGPGSENLTISGNNLYRILFIGAGNSPFTAASPAAPTVVIKNLTLANGAGKGFSGLQGSGASAGMGGAIFLNAGSLRAENILFSGNSAVGGNGSSGYNYGGSGFGGSGIIIGAGGSSGYLGGTPGAAVTSGAGIGGVGGIGGGGGYGSSTGGAGGFAGGGGGGGYNGGAGGFGAGGGATWQAAGAQGLGGFGGGKAGYSGGGHSGSGAGMGGAVFQKSGTLYLLDCTFNSNSTTAGTVTNAAATTGSTYGGAVFIYGGSYQFKKPSYSGNSAANSPDVYKYGGASLAFEPSTEIMQPNDITESSAYLKAIINPKGFETIYYFEYSTKADLSDAISTTASSAGSGSSAVAGIAKVENLTPGVRYYYRVIAENEMGYTISSITSFKYTSKVDDMIFWVKSDSGVTVNGNNNVTSWTDLSSVGRSIFGISNTRLANKDFNYLGGKQTLRFDGPDVMLTDRKIDLTKEYTILITARNHARKNYNGLLRVAGTGTSIASSFELLWDQGTTNVYSGTLQIFANRPSSGTAGMTNYTYTNVGPGIGNFYLLAVRVGTDGNGEIRINGKTLTPSATTGSSLLPAISDSLYLGLGYYNVNGAINGNFAEIMIFDRKINDFELQSLENRMGIYWGVANSTTTAPAIASSTTGNYVLGTTGASVLLTTGSSTSGSLSTSTGTNPTIVGSLPAGVEQISPDKYWTINNTGLTNLTYSLTLDLSSIQSITDFASIKILKRPNASSAWQDVTQSPINASIIYDKPFVTILGLTSFSEFAVGGGTSNSTLPVELSDFSYSTSSNGLILNWKTKTETNNYGWEIEQGTGNKEEGTWKKVGFVAGKGTTTELQTYFFTLPITHYTSHDLFRLKQIDNDGKVEYSHVLAVNLMPESYFLSQNYPNPFNPNTVIKFQLPVNGNVELKVYNLLGQEVAVLVNQFKEAGTYSIQFDGREMTSGIYFYTIKSGSFSQTKRMMLVK